MPSSFCRFPNRKGWQKTKQLALSHLTCPTNLLAAVKAPCFLLQGRSALDRELDNQTFIRTERLGAIVGLLKSAHRMQMLVKSHETEATRFGHALSADPVHVAHDASLRKENCFKRRAEELDKKTHDTSKIRTMTHVQYLKT